ncbi:hypothetical protein AVEN_53400-1 [Araneus ventricosus]|uniref:Uncharacterized protein n=1 Tax=Araneus ventricosus TaxID=182803 RepID=A0A4Y2AA83_ARAVE|nr:hypothetical protein AVEN_53400-1 [Araneus ventricosus]
MPAESIPIEQNPEVSSSNSCSSAMLCLILLVGHLTKLNYSTHAVKPKYGYDPFSTHTQKLLLTLNCIFQSIISNNFIGNEYDRPSETQPLVQVQNKRFSVQNNPKAAWLLRPCIEYQSIITDN